MKLNEIVKNWVRSRILNLKLFKGCSGDRCEHYGRGSSSTSLYLLLGQSLTSPNGVAKLVMQADGNLVVLCHGASTWQSGTGGMDIRTGLAIQDDGNLVLYIQSGGFVWTPSTCCRTTGTSVIVQNDGNVIVKDRASGNVVWNTGTSCIHLISPGEPP